jgi:type II secretory pathway predicted ATPase ExeA
MKEFNIAGPCIKRLHYMIDAVARIQGVDTLIDGRKYFVLHAARQSGKTTFIQDLANRLNAEGKYYALYCSLENLQGIVDSKEGIPELVKNIISSLLFFKLPEGVKFAENANYNDYTTVLQDELSIFCSKLDKPLVVFFDEADCLSEGTLITFLRQLRNGHNRREMAPFVHSVALVGMRNIRDFKAKVRPDHETLGSASPFNIVTKAITLTNFTKEEVSELYAQHTADTGQIFDDDAIDFIYEQTCGQPWLVNAVAREVIVEELSSDFSKPVTKELAAQAIQTIILRRDTHIDSLLERLKEERVRNVIEPMILGEYVDVVTDDFQYVKDLGLIKQTPQILPANPVYAEVIFRTLNYNVQETLKREDNNLYQAPRYMKNGRIDMDFLMSDFQQFWRENSEIWEERFQYKEAAPHLVLMAFLQRVINGGGQIIREAAVGKKRLDLCIVYENQKYPVELKIDRYKNTLEDGLKQTAEYAGKFGCSEGYLCIFDRSPEKSWDEKIYMRSETVEGKKITIVGL